MQKPTCLALVGQAIPEGCLHLRQMGTWPKVTFSAAWVNVKWHVTVVSSLYLRHEGLAPSTPPRSVHVVEVALPLLPAGVYQSSPCSGPWLFARVEWQSGLPSPGHTLPHLTKVLASGCAVER